MKKLSNIFICGLLMVASLSGCTTQKNIVDYYLNDNGNLIGKYEDGSTIDFGDFNPDAVGAINKVTISDDGYYVINGIKTEIKAKQVSGYHLNDKGHLIVEYSDGTTEDLGEFDEDISGEVETITISDDGYYVINGTKTNIVAKQSYTVKFNTGCSIKVEDQKVLEGHKIIKPEINREGYTLNGWYCNDEDWRFNSDIVLNDMTLEAKWSANKYLVKFDSKIGQEIQDMEVTFGQNYDLPVLSKTGHTFNGWYYNGNKVTGKPWNVAKNVTLIANWSANVYTITLDANGGTLNGASTKQVTYGEKFKLPVASNSFGVFTGWYLGDEKITDNQGNSLGVWNYLENKTLTTSWITSIKTVDDLKNINTGLNGHYKLENDIVLTDIDWQPIGTKENPFNGEFDGNNHSIIGLSITSNHTYNGLFGCSKNALLKNINLNDVSMKISVRSESYTASLVGYAIGNISLLNCSANGQIQVNKHSTDYLEYIGGFVSYCDTLEACNLTNSINISGNQINGGIVGLSKDLKMEECFNKANISSNECAAGLVSQSSNATINKCYNSGNIECLLVAGGLIGDSNNLICTNSFNKGNVTSTKQDNQITQKGVGGIAGWIADGKIMNCYNQGWVKTGSLFAGGIVGLCYRPKISKCYNSGNISSASDVIISYCGGILGCVHIYSNEESYIKECASLGNVYGGGVTATIGYDLGQSGNIIVDCVYNSTAAGTASDQGSKVASSYGHSIYLDQLFWDAYNPIDKTGEWIFDENDYPRLWWEQIILNN